MKKAILIFLMFFTLSCSDDHSQELEQARGQVRAQKLAQQELLKEWHARTEDGTPYMSYELNGKREAYIAYSSIASARPLLHLYIPYDKIFHKAHFIHFEVDGKLITVTSPKFNIHKSSIRLYLGEKIIAAMKRGSVFRLYSELANLEMTMQLKGFTRAFNQAFR